MAHSRDNEEVGMVHLIIYPKSQMMMGQYWSGKTMYTQTSFQINQKRFQKVPVLKKHLTEFSTD